jgi:hypothetical protein
MSPTLFTHVKYATRYLASELENLEIRSEFKSLFDFDLPDPPQPILTVTVVSRTPYDWHDTSSQVSTMVLDTRQSHADSLERPLFCSFKD